MNRLTRAVELTKARVLELEAAYLECTLEICDTHDELVTALREHIAGNKKQCQEIRDEVGQWEADRN